MLVSWYTLMWFSQHLNDMNIRKWPVPSIHVNFAEKKSAYYIWNVTRYECLMFCMQDFTTSFTRLFDKLEKKEVIWSSSFIQTRWYTSSPRGTYSSGTRSTWWTCLPSPPKPHPPPTSPSPASSRAGYTSPSLPRRWDIYYLTLTLFSSILWQKGDLLLHEWVYNKPNVI